MSLRLQIIKEVEINEQNKLRKCQFFFLQHAYNVSWLSRKIGIELGLNDQEIKVLVCAAMIHDIGKLFIPKEILWKPSPLNDEEYSVIKHHPEYGLHCHIGEDIVCDEDICNVIKFHHERYDGKGYPFGLKGEEIPLMARIVCVADSYDAMTADRGYNIPKTAEEAVEEIKKCSGTQFDPAVVNAFLSYHDHRCKTLTLGK